MTPAQEEVLELTSTIALIGELLKRFDHVIVSGIQVRPTGEQPENQHSMWQFKGDPHLCQGLAYDVAARIQVRLLETERPMGVDDL